MESITKVAEDFCAACERGERWDVCKSYCARAHDENLARRPGDQGTRLGVACNRGEIALRHVR